MELVRLVHTVEVHVRVDNLIHARGHCFHQSFFQRSEFDRERFFDLNNIAFSFVAIELGSISNRKGEGGDHSDLELLFIDLGHPLDLVEGYPVAIFIAVSFLIMSSHNTLFALGNAANDSLLAFFSVFIKDDVVVPEIDKSVAE